jgi:hypothetical protein
MNRRRIVFTGCRPTNKPKIKALMPRTFLLVLLAIIFLAFNTTHNRSSEKEANVAVAKVSLAAAGEAAASSARMKIEDTIREVYDDINLSAENLDFEVFRLAMIGYMGLREQGAISDKQILTIIDFNQPSTEKRLFSIDLKNKRLKYHTYVAHGKNTGENMATAFSNVPHSNQSSLGFYVTGETYVGSKGYSLRLDGMEEPFNGNIRTRAVVVHGARYVSESWIRNYGRLGRSQGCPALPMDISDEVIDAIKGGTAMFAYYPDDTYMKTSRYIQMDTLVQQLVADGSAAKVTLPRRS